MGLHLALACDMAVCADTASFSEPFSDRGFNVDSGGSWLVPRAIGLSRAKRLLFTSEVVDAATAAAWGLVHDVVSESDLDARTVELAARLAAGPTFAIGVTKSLLHHGGQSGLRDALEREAHGVELTIRSDDFKEGMNAFRDKRPPRFSGR
jgi:2-(1,2-epoxy-1,2-dihydrophenyl)acetyl-CoA isomerase